MSDLPPPPVGPPPGPPPPVGPPPGPPPPGPAVPGRPLEIGVWLTDTTRTMVHGFGEFFAVLTVVSLISTAIAAPLLWIGAQDLVLGREGNQLTSVEGFGGEQAALIGLWFAVTLGSQVLLFTAATLHTDRVRRGESPRWQESLGALVRRGPRVIAVVVQAVLLGFVLLTLSGILGVVGLGAVATVLGFVAVIWLWIRCAVAPTHAALGAAGSSIAASFRWTKGLSWPLLGRHVLLITLVFGVLLIASFVAAPFQSLGGTEPLAAGDLAVADILGENVAAFLAVQFINVLASGVAAALWAAAMLSLLRNAPVVD